MSNTPFASVSGVFSFSAATSGNVGIQILPLSDTGQQYSDYFIENQGTVIAYALLGPTKSSVGTINVAVVGTPGNAIPVLPGTSIVLPGPNRAWFNAQSASSTATLVITGGTGALTAFGSGSGSSGSSGTVTSVDASGGVETSSGSPITASGTIRGAHLVNAQTGTTYTYVTGDRGKLVTHTNASAIAGTLPQATSTFGSGWYMYVENRGAGTLTITPTTSTIDGAATLALTTNQGCLIASDGTNYFTMRGIGGGLTNWTEAVNSSSPNATVPVVSFTVSNAATNVDVALIAKGTGAITAQIADNGTTGGNKRGNNAVDWQTATRGANTQVASGNNSVVSGGIRNTASNGGDVVSGGTANIASGGNSSVAGGNTNTASGSQAFVGAGANNTASGGNTTIGGGNLNAASGTSATVPGGSNNTASGDYSIASGQRSSTLGLQGAIAHAAVTLGAGIFTQKLEMVLVSQTTNATPTVLTANASTASTTNQLVLPNANSVCGTGWVTARNTANTDTAGWKFDFVLSRGANAASTALVAAVTPVLTAASAGAATWALAVTADTTNGGLAVTFTGVAATTIDTTCVLHTAMAK